MVWDGVCRQSSPRENGAERYSLMRKLTVTEPHAETLELCFAMGDCEGAHQIKETLRRRQKHLNIRLQRLTINPCNATDLKVMLTSILVKSLMHLKNSMYDFGDSPAVLI
jgi:hypothetical protein